jgi:hypothetical protein
MNFETTPSSFGNPAPVLVVSALILALIWLVDSNTRWLKT